MSPLPVIDPEAIASLRALSPDDDDVFLKEILAIFMEDTPVRIDELRSSLTGGNAELFVRSAHSIKGSASNVGAAELRAIAELLERRGRQTGPSGSEEMLAELEAAFARASDVLKTFITE